MTFTFYCERGGRWWPFFLASEPLNAHAQPVDRRAERVHLFLVATLYFGRASNPVRVRNLSATGALVEGAVLPPPGSTVVLRRGALEAAGTAVWSDGGKAGLAFSGLLEVSEWLPTKEAKPQTRVDQIAFGLKQARAAGLAAVRAAEEGPSLAALALELAAVHAQLGTLGDQLALDAFVLANHPEIQLLDAAGQRIGRIAAALRAAAER